MDRLELYAKESEQEKEVLKRDAAIALKYGHMSQNVLEYFIEKSFHLGHNAGHCRGESYKYNRERNLI